MNGWFCSSPIGSRYPHLAAYVQNETRSNNAMASVVGGVSGILFGTAGAAIGGLVGGAQMPIEIVMPTAFGVAAAGTLLTWWLVARRESAIDRESRRLRQHSRMQLWRLMTYHSQGHGDPMTAERTLKTLDSAAEQWLRIRSALKAPAWDAAATDSPWASARDKARRSADGAMARLIMLAGQGALLTDTPASTSILKDLTRLADECVRLADRIEPVGVSAAGGATGLRDALSEIQMLNAAESELEAAGIEQLLEQVERPDSSDPRT